MIFHIEGPYLVERERQEPQGRESVEPGFADGRNLVAVEGEFLDAVEAEEGSVHQVLDLKNRNRSQGQPLFSQVG